MDTDKKMSNFKDICLNYCKPRIPYIAVILFLIVIVIIILSTRKKCEPMKKNKEKYIDGPIRSDQQSDYNLNDQLKLFVKKQENYIRTLGVL